ncbi:MAG: hypothetical protein BWY83_02050 [bacterium ADurb.Bin478]|nr:MAG: hypothetical protein BWY83_02050 [bacterium ADurb.Bin478]
MKHAEFVLFIDDQQTQILELDIGGEQAMRADDQVHLARFEPLDDLPLRSRLAKSIEHLDANRVGLQSFAEGDKMLLRQNRGRHQDRHLFTVIQSLKGGAHRHLGFAKPHIAADQPIHGNRLFHILFNILYRSELVLGLFV